MTTFLDKMKSYPKISVRRLLKPVKLWIRGKHRMRHAPITAKACRVCGDIERPKYRISIQWSMFRGDDENLFACERCKDSDARVLAEVLMVEATPK